MATVDALDQREGVDDDEVEGPARDVQDARHGLVVDRRRFDRVPRRGQDAQPGVVGNAEHAQEALVQSIDLERGIADRRFRRQIEELAHRSVLQRRIDQEHSTREPTGHGAGDAERQRRLADATLVSEERDDTSALGPDPLEQIRCRRLEACINPRWSVPAKPAAFGVRNLIERAACQPPPRNRVRWAPTYILIHRLTGVPDTAGLFDPYMPIQSDDSGQPVFLGVPTTVEPNE